MYCKLPEDENSAGLTTAPKNIREKTVHLMTVDKTSNCECTVYELSKFSSTPETFGWAKHFVENKVILQSYNNT